VFVPEAQKVSKSKCKNKSKSKSGSERETACARQRQEGQGRRGGCIERQRDWMIERVRDREG